MWTLCLSDAAWIFTPRYHGGTTSRWQRQFYSMKYTFGCTQNVFIECMFSLVNVAVVAVFGTLIPDAKLLSGLTRYTHVHSFRLLVYLILWFWNRNGVQSFLSLFIFIASIFVALSFKIFKTIPLLHPHFGLFE